MRDKRFGLVMTADEFEAMAARAEDLGISMATAVRLALRAWTAQPNDHRARAANDHNGHNPAGQHAPAG